MSNFQILGGKRKIKRPRSLKDMHNQISIIKAISVFHPLSVEIECRSSPLSVEIQRERQTPLKEVKLSKKHLGCTADQVSEAFSFIHSVLLLFVYYFQSGSSQQII